MIRDHHFNISPPLSPEDRIGAASHMQLMLWYVGRYLGMYIACSAYLGRYLGRYILFMEVRLIFLPYSRSC